MAAVVVYYVRQNTLIGDTTTRVVERHGGHPARLSLAKLARAARGGVITVERAAEALSVSRRTAALKASGFARRGWLLRLRRGTYLVLPLEVEPGRPTTVEDPWVLASVVFAPCYIGGWSAAEHWGLTEQIFRSTLVVTAAHVRRQSASVAGQEFRLFRIPRARLAGSVTVWRAAERVAVSDRERTIVDSLRRPELMGGVRHLTDVMREYAHHPEHNFGKLTAVARDFASGAGWKRLGYLAEQLWPEQDALIAEARSRVTAGYVRLDPAVKARGSLVRRWGIQVNVVVDRHVQPA